MDADGNSAQPTVKEPIDDATKENVYSIAKQLHHLMVLCSGVGVVTGKCLIHVAA